MPTVCFGKDRLLVFFGEGEGGFPLGREFTPLVASYQTQICARAIKRSYKLLLQKKNKKCLDPKGIHSKFFGNPSNKSDLYINRCHKLGMSLGFQMSFEGLWEEFNYCNFAFFSVSIVGYSKGEEDKVSCQAEVETETSKKVTFLRFFHFLHMLLPYIFRDF